MYVGLYIKYPLFLSDFNKIWILQKYSKINFMKFRLLGAELFHAAGRTDGWTDRQTGRHDEANSRSSKFYEPA